MPEALFNRVVVEEVKDKIVVKTEQGIELDKTAVAQAHTTAKVIMVGPDVTATKVGDTVMFTAGSGNPIMIEGKEMILLRDEQLDIVL